MTFRLPRDLLTEKTVLLPSRVVFRLYAGMPKAPVAPLCFSQLPHLPQLSLAYRSKNQLGNAIAPSDSKRGLAEINQTDLDLASVVGIYSPRRIDDSDAVLDCQAGSRAYLHFKTIGQGNGKSGGKELDFSGLKHCVFSYCRRRIHARRLSGCVGGQREIPTAVGISLCPPTQPDRRRAWMRRRQ